MKETVIAVDLGGTKILVGEVSLTGEILSSQSYPSDVSSQRNALDKIKVALSQYLLTNKRHGQVLGIGIGVVGRVDSLAGIWYEIHPGLAEEICVTEEITQQFGLPCFIANDVTNAAMAELMLGIGKATKDFIYINIGTGIAGRTVSDGQLLQGGHNNAGEVGHMVVDIHSDIQCSCGRYGCIETIASGLGMHKQAIKLASQYPETKLEVNAERISFQELIQAYETEDLLAKAVVDQALQATAAFIMNLVRVSDPEAVVFGGGVMSNGWFLKHMQQYLNPQTLRFVTQGLQVTTLDPQTIAFKGAALQMIKKAKGADRYEQTARSTVELRLPSSATGTE